MSLYKFVDESRIDIIQHLSIRFSQPIHWNDPFEMRPFYFDDKKPEFVGELLDPDYIGIDNIEVLINENFVSLSLTENPANLLMWAHYTKNHRGFLIEFDETNDFFRDKQKYLFKIPYSNIRPVLGKRTVLKLISELINTLKDGSVIDMENLHRLSSIFHKSIDWKDEQEWRLITLTDFADNLTKIEKKRKAYFSFGIDSPAINKIRSDYVAMFNLPPESIKSIIFGCNVNQKLRRNIYNLKEANSSLSHVVLYQALIDKKEYRLYTQEINPIEIFSVFELQKKGIN